MRSANELKNLRQLVRLTEVQFNHVLGVAFDMWPVPDNTTLTDQQVLLVFTVDTLARLGVLDTITGTTLAKVIYPRVANLDIYDKANYNDWCVRLADRQYLAVPEGFYDLSTGQVFREPRQFMEKTIYDLSVLFSIRSSVTQPT